MNFKYKNTLIVIGLILAISCSTKKAGITNRTYHRLTSWYNTTFNGNETLLKLMNDKSKSYQDNFTSLLPVEPINPFEESKDNINSILNNNTSNTSNQSNNNNVGMSPQVVVNKAADRVSNAVLGDTKQSTATGLDRVIEKSKKAIENHSILLSGKEYNSMLAEAYLLLGKAYYYKQQPIDAMNYLNYMDKNLVKSHKKNEAKTYMALAQAQSGNTFEANEIFLSLTQEKKIKKRDKKLISRAYSQFLINQKEYEKAIDALEVAKKYNKGKYNRGRYNFIQAQLFEKLDNKEEARNHYWAAYKKKPSTELEIKSQIALANLFEGDSVQYKEHLAFLKKLSKKGLYISHKNELIYAMGVTSLKVNKENDAMNFFKKALKEKQSDEQVRALTYKSIGDIYFSKPEYLYAGAYYDSAVSRFRDPAMKRNLEQKNKNLKIIIQKYYLVKKNDSILNLVKMSPEEKKSYYQKFIDNLKAKEEKERLEAEKNKEESESVFLTDNASFDNNQTNTTATSGGKFYFYNTSAVQDGQRNFKRIWGNRQLGDNWRYGRISAGLEEQKSQMLGQTSKGNPRRFEIDFYLEKLPKTAKAVDSIKMERDTVELALGNIYYDKLKDTKSSTQTLEHLLASPPATENIKISALYSLYKINKNSNSDLAKKYENLIVTQYPNSKYAEYIMNPQIDIFTAKSSAAVNDYKIAYEKYKEGKFEEVKLLTQQAIEKYPTDEMLAKFSLLAAICEGKLGNKQNFLDALERVSIVFDTKEEGKKAKELFDYFTNKEKKQAPTKSKAFPQKNNAEPTQGNTINSKKEEEMIDVEMKPQIIENSKAQRIKTQKETQQK